MKRFYFAPLLLAALVAAPATLPAQACLGVPQGTELGLGVGADLHQGARHYTLSGLAALGRGVFLGGSIEATSYEVHGFGYSSDVNAAVLVALELPPLPGDVRACPQVGIEHDPVVGAGRSSIPVGIGIGRTFTLGTEGAQSVTPYFFPQYVHVEGFEEEGIEVPEASHVGLEAGTTVGLGALYVGARVRTAVGEDREPVFGFFGGVRI